MDPYRKSQAVTALTLRDYFAAAVLQGIFAGALSRDHVVFQVGDCDDIARRCYQMADAMSRARC